MVTPGEGRSLRWLGLQFEDLWGRWPTLIDWQNVFCEVSKYTRMSHPHLLIAGRTKNQATVPADVDRHRLPVPAEMGPAARAHGRPADSVSGATNSRLEVGKPARPDRGHASIARTG